MNTEAKGSVTRRQVLGGLIAATLLVSGDTRPLNRPDRRQRYEPHIIRFAEENPEGKSFVLSQDAFRGVTSENTVPFPSDIVRHFEPLFHVVNGVLTPANQVHGLALGQFYEGTTSNGEKSYIESFPNAGEPDINFIMYPGIPYYYGDMERIIFHESMHRLNIQGKHAAVNTPQAYNFWEKLGKTHGKKEGASTYDLAREDTPINLEQTGLFPLFDESSYITHFVSSMGRFGQDQGHPYDDPDELLASTLNVLRHFPRGFMASVATLPPQEVGLVKQFTRFVLTQSQRAASNSHNFAALFNPQLLQYLAV